MSLGTSEVQSAPFHASTLSSDRRFLSLIRDYPIANRLMVSDVKPNEMRGHPQCHGSHGMLNS